VTGNNKIIEERKPVWIALSNLYLDTELQEDDYKYMAEVFYKSPYSLAEIDLINKYEVAPVLMPNLLSVAGEWAGFDEDWLIESITSKIKDYNRIKNKRSGIMRFMYNLFWKSDWKKINTHYADLEK
jgi:hypothetical protein